ncbi:MAG TPA: uroporphyrinogen-III C-methyltransferase [Burkholderiales bacterium]
MSANEQSAKPESEATGSPVSEQRLPPPPSAKRGGRVSGGLALILSLIALLGTGYLWYTLIHERPALTQLDLPARFAELERALGELRSALDDTEDQVAALAETQSALRTAVDGLRAELGRSQTQWMVSEAEQLLLIANRRLQLGRDVPAALAALRAADRQLELAGEPALLPVRRQIATEIAQLEAIERADIPGIALRLGTLAQHIEQLPLAPDVRALSERVAAAPEEAEAPGESIWRDLMSLVRIRRHEGVQRPLLPPEQQYFVRENMRLMLYGAQHALLQGNAATYRQNLGTAATWLREYYDRGAPAVAGLIDELEKLRETAIMSELPDISASLDMLRKASGRQRGS